MFQGASADFKKGLFIGLGVGAAFIVVGMVSGVFRKV